MESPGIQKSAFALALLSAIPLINAAQVPVAAVATTLTNNTPRFVQTAKNLGAANPSQTIDVTVWLKVHDRNGLDALAEELYDSNSSHYHAWLTPEEMAARFAPTAQEAQAVEQFLSANNLPVVAVGPQNYFVRARGTLGQVATAFRVKIDQFDVNGTVRRANTSDPVVTGPVAAIIHHISGLSDQAYQHPLITRATSGTKQTVSNYQSDAIPATTSFFSSVCFNGWKSDSFNTGGDLPAATYSGNAYGGTTIEGCGYTPPEIQTAYHLKALYNEGFDGTGQTIVIIDWCGSPTITADANAFSARFGLPPLTASNFKIIDYPIQSSCVAANGEINLDVEWAHAIAPGANIVLLVPPSATFQDTDTAELYAIAHHLGNVISNSYGAPEELVGATDLDEENLINELAAVSGISANFSTGDEGDFTVENIPPTVSFPASTPFATAIGGSTLALNASNKILWQSGWGNNLTFLDEGGIVQDPPYTQGFYAGSGGGPSGFFAKPSYQKNLPGTTRQVPDISWLADPYNGAVIAITEPLAFPPFQYTAIGGTSWACPMFSALWAIANQEAGAPLGQAARYVYSMPPSTITDIVPVGSANNVTGAVLDSYGVIGYSADDLAGPLDGTTTFYSALWDVPLNQGTTLIVTFGTDSSLQTAKGWDDVTGVGVPKAKAFADYFNPAKP